VAGDAPEDKGEPLLVQRRGPVMSLVLNRPERKNALSAEMITDITEAIAQASIDDETRVVVVTAKGTDFCSGIDLVESNRRDRGSQGEGKKPRTGHLQRGFHTGAHKMIQTIFAAQVPVVCGVQGWAAGIGNALALSADITIASDTAKFWVPFVTKGFTPDSGNSWLIPRLVGLARAKEMILRGKPVEGQRAADWGLISHCVPEDQLEDSVNQVVEDFARMATVSVGLAKALLHGNLESPFAVALQNEGIYEELAVRSDDFKEGMKAFAQKRTPEFVGW
jgi:2-(1,2-epoxy-1,2-dihydrophenyl)acetyl-CoA isomerase